MNVSGRGLWRPARAGLLLAVAAASFGVVGLSSQAAAVPVKRAGAREALAFWTAARMRRAKPLDLHLPSRRGFAPRPGGAASSSSASEAVADPTAAPARQNGAVFIVTPFGLGRCSGTAVNSPNFSVVFTAAHCIRTGGRRGRWFDYRWVFVPGYRYGQRPFGVFPAKWIDTTRRWRTVGGPNNDVGAAVVGRNARGRLLTKAVGGAGIAWGLPAKQVFDVHGYPATRPFDGRTQRVCTGVPFLGHDTLSFLSPGPLNLGVECHVTSGASGGGWTIRDGVLNSVTSYGRPHDRETVFGPYFGKEVARLFGRASRVR